MKNLNMSGIGFESSVNSLELQEARKRMGMTNNSTNGTSLTSLESLPNLVNSKYTSQTEIQRAMQSINRFS